MAFYFNGISDVFNMCVSEQSRKFVRTHENTYL